MAVRVRCACRLAEVARSGARVECEVITGNTARGDKRGREGAHSVELVGANISQSRNSTE